MAESATVTSENCPPGYALESFNSQAIDRSGLEIEHFERTSQIKIIQEALNIDQTGQWDAETNSRFTEWLRIEQATHLGEDQADGWIGNVSLQGLDGKIDPTMHDAIESLYEDGSLNKIHYRNQMHNATLVKLDDGSCTIEGGSLTQETPQTLNDIEPEAGNADVDSGQTPSQTIEQESPEGINDAGVSSNTREQSHETPENVAGSPADSREQSQETPQDEAVLPTDEVVRPEVTNANGLNEFFAQVDSEMSDLYVYKTMGNSSVGFNPVINGRSDMLEHAENEEYQEAVNEADQLLENANRDIDIVQYTHVSRMLNHIDLTSLDSPDFISGEELDAALRAHPETGIRGEAVGNITEAMRNPELRDQIRNHINTSTNVPDAEKDSYLAVIDEIERLETQKTEFDQMRSNLSSLAAENGLTVNAPTAANTAADIELTTADTDTSPPPQFTGENAELANDLAARIESLGRNQEEIFQQIRDYLPEGTTIDDLRDPEIGLEIRRWASQRYDEVMQEDERVVGSNGQVTYDQEVWRRKTEARITDQKVDEFFVYEAARDTLQNQLDTLTGNARGEPGVLELKNPTYSGLSDDEVVDHPWEHNVDSMLAYVVSSSGAYPSDLNDLTDEQTRQLRMISTYAGNIVRGADGELTDEAKAHFASPENIADFYIAEFTTDENGNSLLSTEDEATLRASIEYYERIPVSKDEIQQYIDAQKADHIERFTHNTHAGMLRQFPKPTDMPQEEYEAFIADRVNEAMPQVESRIVDMPWQVAEHHVRNAKFLRALGEDGELTHRVGNEDVTVTRISAITEQLPESRQRSFFRNRDIVHVGATAKKMVEGYNADLTLESTNDAEADQSNLEISAAEPDNTPPTVTQTNADVVLDTSDLSGSLMASIVAGTAERENSATISGSDAVSVIRSHLEDLDVSPYQITEQDIDRLEAAGIDPTKEYDLTNPNEFSNLLISVEAYAKNTSPGELPQSRLDELQAAATERSASVEPPKSENALDTSNLSGTFMGQMIEHSANENEGTAIKGSDAVSIIRSHVEDLDMSPYQLSEEDTSRLEAAGLDPDKTYDLSNPEEFSNLLVSIEAYLQDTSPDKLDADRVTELSTTGQTLAADIHIPTLADNPFGFTEYSNAALIITSDPDVDTLTLENQTELVADHLSQIANLSSYEADDPNTLTLTDGVNALKGLQSEDLFDLSEQDIQTIKDVAEEMGFDQNHAFIIPDELVTLVKAIANFENFDEPAEERQELLSQIDNVLEDPSHEDQTPSNEETLDATSNVQKITSPPTTFA
jgi:hypothetical protein